MINPNDYSLESPHPAKAEPKKQAGYDIVVAACPRCGNTVAATGEGRAFCVCGLWVRLELAK